MIKFDVNEREQAGKLVRYRDIVAGIVNILVIKNNNRLLFKNNIQYVWARFIEASKMTKGSMTIFFINLNLAPMQEHLNYKNMDKMRALLTELPYSKVI